MHLPHVGGVRLQDIDRIEIYLARIAEPACSERELPPKRRSGITAKHQNYGRSAKGRQLVVVVVQLLDQKVGRTIAHIQLSVARSHPKRLERKHE